MLLKSLRNANDFLTYLNLQKLEIIKVSGSNYISLVHAYNEAQKVATYKIKVFIHEDLDLLEGDWVLKLIKLFENTETGLVGLTGTPKMSNTNFFWWNYDASNYENIY